MDPLVSEWLRAALAFLFGAIIAAASRRWGFRDALELQKRDARRRNDGLQRALMNEAEENAGRARANLDQVRGGDRRNGQYSLLSRRAWDLASELDLAPIARRAVLIAYRAADEANAAVAFVVAHQGPLGSGELGEGFWKRLVDSAEAAASAFDGVRDVLAKL